MSQSVHSATLLALTIVAIPYRLRKRGRRKSADTLRAEKSEDKEKRHTLVIVNAVTGSQQELVKALKENGRELRAVLRPCRPLQMFKRAWGNASSHLREICQDYPARGRLKISRKAEVQTRRPPNGKEDSVPEL